MKLRAALFLGFLTCTAWAQTPTIRANAGVLNAASFDANSPITPGSLFSIFGTALSSRTAAADSIPLSNSLGGVTVNFVNGSTTLPAPMLYVGPDSASSPSQINAQVPWNLVPQGTSATVNVIVTRDGVQSAPTAVNIGPFSPGIFQSGGQAIAVNLDGTLAWAANSIAGLTTHPAKPGDTVIVYATGLGAVDSSPANGAASQDKLRFLLTPPQVMIGGLTATVTFAGLAPQFVGVNQLNVVIPNAAAGARVPIQLQLGGITTSNAITMAVGQ